MKLIPKEALVAEIERRKNKNQKICTAEGSGAFYEDGFILDIINSFEVKEVNEVKEVDLEKEIEEWLYNGDITDTRFDDYRDSDIESTAKHFFELGLNTQKLEV